MIRKQILAIAAFCLLGFLIYSHTFQVQFYFDDRSHILNNLSIRNPLDLKAIWDFWSTRFITFLSFSVNYLIHRWDVFGYHLVNLVIHLLSAFLLWRLVLSTFSLPAAGKEKVEPQRDKIAFFAALIFIAHPIQTQAVTYIYQRSACLAAFFYLAALLFYLKARLERRRSFYIGSLAMGILAMLSKEVSVTLPLTLMLYEYFFLRSRGKVEWKYCLPFFAVALLVPLSLFLTKPESFQDIRRISEVPAAVYIRYPLTQLRVVMTYIRLLFLPYNQNLDYDYPFSSGIWEPGVLASLLAIIFILVMAGRISARYKMAAFGIFWFFITLLPESSFIPLKDLIFEHRLYLPMAGFSIFLASGVFYLFKRVDRRVPVVILTAVALVYSGLAFNRNRIWADEIVLCNDTVKKSPRKARVYNSRGLAYARRGLGDKALADFNRALEIDPQHADLYVSRGIVYASQGLYGRALADFNRALEITPASVYAYYSRGDFYFNRELYALALADFNRALEIDPRLIEAYNQRGVIYSRQARYAEAVSEFNRAIELDSGSAQAYNNLGIVYANQGFYDRAAGEFTRALKAEPGYADAYVNRGNAWDSQGLYPQAISDFTRALKLNPESSDAYNGRGVTSSHQGEYARAISDFIRARELNPDYAVTYFNLGLAYSSLGERKKAKANLEKAGELFKQGKNYQAARKIEQAIKALSD